MNDDLRQMIVASARKLGISPVDLATVISYETAGTFDPQKKGPTTQWGQHQGLIQWGQPQAQKYLGGDFSIPRQGDGIVAYMQDAGVKPGMGLLDVYSAVNAGSVGRYNASDANNGGAPGTVRDKVERQMAGHRRKAESLLGAQLSPEEQRFVDNNPQPGGYGPGINDPNAPPVWGSLAPKPPPNTEPAGIPKFVADYATSDDGNSNLKAFASALSQVDVMPAPRPPAFPGGPTDAQTGALFAALNKPNIADFLRRKRLG